MGSEIYFTKEHDLARKAVRDFVKKQVLRHRLANWLAQAESLQQLTYHIVRMKMAGQDVTREISGKWSR